jgi:hypothetical protein
VALSTIVDLLSTFQQRDLPLTVNGGVGSLKFSRYVSSDLTSSNLSKIFSHGCRKDVCPYNFCPDCYVLNSGDSVACQNPPAGSD